MRLYQVTIHLQCSNPLQQRNILDESLVITTIEFHYDGGSHYKVTKFQSSKCP